MLSTKLFSQKQMDLLLSCTTVKGGKGDISLFPLDTVQKCFTDKMQTKTSFFIQTPCTGSQQGVA